MPRALISAAFLCLLGALPNAYAARKADPKWFQCKADADCIVVSGICAAPTAIHRDHEKDAKDYYRWRGTADSCQMAKQPEVPPAAKCEARKCGTRK